MPGSEQEQITNGRTVEEQPVQVPLYLPRGHQDRGDASSGAVPTARAGSGCRSTGTAHGSDQLDAQVPQESQSTARAASCCSGSWHSPDTTHLNTLNSGLGRGELRKYKFPYGTVG